MLAGRRCDPLHGYLAAGVSLTAGLASGTVAYLCKFSENSSLIARIAVGRSPSAIAVDPRSGHVFVANSGDNTLTMLDARSGAVLRTIIVGAYPDQMQVNPQTERVFVMNEGDGSVSVVDARTGDSLGALPLPEPSSGPAVDGHQSTAFAFAAPGGGTSGLGGQPGAIGGWSPGSSAG